MITIQHLYSHNNYNNSQSSCKQSPKMQRSNGRFQVVDYDNQPHNRVSYKKRSQNIYFLDENNLIINCKQFLSNDISISMLSLKVLHKLCSKWHSTYSEQRDCTMHKVVAYKQLKTIEMSNVIPKSACAGLSIKRVGRL